MKRARDGAHGDAQRIAATVATRVVVAVTSAAGTILLARTLHPTGQGTYALIITTATTAYMLGHLSIEQSDILLWHRGEDREAIASTTVVLCLAAGSAAAAIAWLVVVGLGGSSFSASDRSLVLLSLPAVPLLALYTCLFGLCFLDRRISRVNVARLLAAASQLVVLGVLLFTDDLTVRTAVIVWVITLAALPVVIAAPGLGIRLRRVSASMARALLRTGFQYHLGMAALFMLWRIDTFLLNAQASRHEVGLYVVAVTAAESLYLVTDSVAQVSLPHQLEGSLGDSADYTARITRVNTVAALVIAAGIALVSPFLLPLIFGTGYDGSVGPLLALLPGVVAFGLIRPITPVLVRLDRPLRVSFFCGIALALNVVLNLLLIPVAGAVGCAIASSVAYAALAAVYIVWLLRSTPLRLSDLRPARRDLDMILRRRAPADASARVAPAAVETGTEG